MDVVDIVSLDFDNASTMASISFFGSPSVHVMFFFCVNKYMHHSISYVIRKVTRKYLEIPRITLKNLKIERLCDMVLAVMLCEWVIY